MVVEAQRAVAFVFDALKADAGVGGVNTLLGGRLYRDQVPQAAALPAGIVSLVSSTDSNTLGADRVFATTLVDVHLIATGPSYAPINAAADRADVVLQNRGGTSGGAAVVELRREQVMTYLETAAGVTYAHLVMTWRTECYAF